MLEAATASSIPLRPSGLALLLKEKTKHNTLQIYLGNLHWSILSALHSIGGGALKLPSYSDLWDQVMDETSEKNKKTRAKKEIEKVQAATADMISRFLNRGDTE